MLSGRKAKAKNSICFQGAIIEAASTLSFKCGTATVLPWELHSKPQHHIVVAVNCACEHLCLISNYFGALVSKMHPKVVAASLYIIWTYKSKELGKYELPYFQIVGSTCIHLFLKFIEHLCSRYCSGSWNIAVSPAMQIV